MTLIDLYNKETKTRTICPYKKDKGGQTIDVGSKYRHRCWNFCDYIKDTKQIKCDYR